MAWTKMKTAALVGVGLLLAVSGGTAIYETHRISHQTLEYFPRASWALSGFGTPESAIKTFMWAESTGDVKTMLSVATPELGQQVEDTYFKNKSDRERAQIVITHVQDVRGVQVQKKTIAAFDTVVFQVHFDGWSDKIYSVITLKKIDGEWKVSNVDDHN